MFRVLLLYSAIISTVWPTNLDNLGLEVEVVDYYHNGMFSINPEDDKVTTIAIGDSIKDTCRIMVFDDSSNTTCIQLVNSNGEEIFCTISKKVCKTEQEIVDYMSYVVDKRLEKRNSSSLTQNKAPINTVSEEKKKDVIEVKREFYKNGNLKSETSYKNGEVYGKFIEYYPNGNYKYKAFFIDKFATEVDGLEEEFYENGNLESVYEYKMGKPIGIGKVYHENGTLALETPHQNGKVNGTQKLYYESGKLQGVIPYVNDKANGEMKTYYEDGKLESTAIIKDHKAISGFNYDQNGTKKEMNNAQLYNITRRLI